MSGSSSSLTTRTLHFFPHGSNLSCVNAPGNAFDKDNPEPWGVMNSSVLPADGLRFSITFTSIYKHVLQIPYPVANYRWVGETSSIPDPQGKLAWHYYYLDQDQNQNSWSSDPAPTSIASGREYIYASGRKQRFEGYWNGSENEIGASMSDAREQYWAIDISGIKIPRSILDISEMYGVTSGYLPPWAKLVVYPDGDFFDGLFATFSINDHGPARTWGFRGDIKYVFPAISPMFTPNQNIEDLFSDEQQIEEGVRIRGLKILSDYPINRPNDFGSSSSSSSSSLALYKPVNITELSNMSLTVTTQMISFLDGEVTDHESSGSYSFAGRFGVGTSYEGVIYEHSSGKYALHIQPAGECWLISFKTDHAQADAVATTKVNFFQLNLKDGEYCGTVDLHGWITPYTPFFGAPIIYHEDNYNKLIISCVFGDGIPIISSSKSSSSNSSSLVPYTSSGSLSSRLDSLEGHFVLQLIKRKFRKKWYTPRYFTPQQKFYGNGTILGRDVVAKVQLPEEFAYFVPVNQTLTFVEKVVYPRKNGEIVTSYCWSNTGVGSSTRTIRLCVFHHENTDRFFSYLDVYDPLCLAVSLVSYGQSGGQEFFLNSSFGKSTSHRLFGTDITEALNFNEHRGFTGSFSLDFDYNSPIVNALELGNNLQASITFEGGRHFDNIPERAIMTPFDEDLWRMDMILYFEMENGLRLLLFRGREDFSANEFLSTGCKKIFHNMLTAETIGQRYVFEEKDAHYFDYMENEEGSLAYKLLASEDRFIQVGFDGQIEASMCLVGEKELARLLDRNYWGDSIADETRNHSRLVKTSQQDSYNATNYGKDFDLQKKHKDWLTSYLKTDSSSYFVWKYPRFTTEHNLRTAAMTLQSVPILGCNSFSIILCDEQFVVNLPVTLREMENGGYDLGDIYPTHVYAITEEKLAFITEDEIRNSQIQGNLFSSVSTAYANEFSGNYPKLIYSPQGSGWDRTASKFVWLHCQFDASIPDKLTMPDESENAYGRSLSEDFVANAFIGHDLTSSVVTLNKTLTEDDLTRVYYFTGRVATKKYLKQIVQVHTVVSNDPVRMYKYYHLDQWYRGCDRYNYTWPYSVVDTITFLPKAQWVEKQQRYIDIWRMSEVTANPWLLRAKWIKQHRNDRPILDETTLLREPVCWAADYTGIVKVYMRFDGKLEQEVVVPRSEIPNKAWFDAFMLSVSSLESRAFLDRTTFSQRYNTYGSSQQQQTSSVDRSPLGFKVDAKDAVEGMLFDVSARALTIPDHQKLPYHRLFAMAITKCNGEIGVPNLDLFGTDAAEGADLSSATFEPVVAVAYGVDEWVRTSQAHVTGLFRDVEIKPRSSCAATSWGVVSSPVLPTNSSSSLSKVGLHPYYHLHPWNTHASYRIIGYYSGMFVGLERWCGVMMGGVWDNLSSNSWVNSSSIVWAGGSITYDYENANWVVHIDSDDPCDYTKSEGKTPSGTYSKVSGSGPSTLTLEQIMPANAAIDTYQAGPVFRFNVPSLDRAGMSSHSMGSLKKRIVIEAQELSINSYTSQVSSHYISDGAGVNLQGYVETWHSHDPEWDGSGDDWYVHSKDSLGQIYYAEFTRSNGGWSVSIEGNPLFGFPSSTNTDGVWYGGEGFLADGSSSFSIDGVNVNVIWPNAKFETYHEVDFGDNSLEPPTEPSLDELKVMLVGANFATNRHIGSDQVSFPNGRWKIEIVGGENRTWNTGFYDYYNKETEESVHDSYQWSLSVSLTETYIQCFSEENSSVKIGMLHGVFSKTGEADVVIDWDLVAAFTPWGLEVVALEMPVTTYSNRMAIFTSRIHNYDSSSITLKNEYIQVMPDLIFRLTPDNDGSNFAHFDIMNKDEVHFWDDSNVPDISNLVFTLKRYPSGGTDADIPNAFGDIDFDWPQVKEFFEVPWPNCRVEDFWYSSVPLENYSYTRKERNPVDNSLDIVHYNNITLHIVATVRAEELVVHAFTIADATSGLPLREGTAWTDDWSIDAVNTSDPDNYWLKLPRCKKDMLSIFGGHIELRKLVQWRKVFIENTDLISLDSHNTSWFSDTWWEAPWPQNPIRIGPYCGFSSFCTPCPKAFAIVVPGELEITSPSSSSSAAMIIGYGNEIVTSVTGVQWTLLTTPVFPTGGIGNKARLFVETLSTTRTNDEGYDMPEGKYSYINIKPSLPIEAFSVETYLKTGGVAVATSRDRTNAIVIAPDPIYTMLTGHWIDPDTLNKFSNPSYAQDIDLYWQHFADDEYLSHIEALSLALSPATSLSDLAACENPSRVLPSSSSSLRISSSSSSLASSSSLSSLYADILWQEQYQKKRGTTIEKPLTVIPSMVDLTFDRSHDHLYCYQDELRFIRFMILDFEITEELSASDTLLVSVLGSIGVINSLGPLNRQQLSSMHLVLDFTTSEFVKAVIHGSAAQKIKITKATALVISGEDFAEIKMRTSRPSAILDRDGKLCIFFESGSNISLLVAGDRGQSPRLFHDLILLKATESATKPLAVLDPKCENVYLFYVLNGNILCVKPLMVTSFVLEDSEKGVSTLPAFDENTTIDILDGLSPAGKVVRLQSSFVILGQTQVLEEEIQDVNYRRSAASLPVRFLAGREDLFDAVERFNGIYSAFIDGQGSLKVWYGKEDGTFGRVSSKNAYMWKIIAEEGSSSSSLSGYTSSSSLSLTDVPQRLKQWESDLTTSTLEFTYPNTSFKLLPYSAMEMFALSDSCTSTRTNEMPLPTSPYIPLETVNNVSEMTMVYNAATDILVHIYIWNNGLYVRWYPNSILNMLEGNQSKEVEDDLKKYLSLTNESPNKPVFLAGDPPTSPDSQFYIIPETNDLYAKLTYGGVDAMAKPACYFNRNGTIRVFYSTKTGSIVEIVLDNKDFKPIQAIEEIE